MKTVFFCLFCGRELKPEVQNPSGRETGDLYCDAPDCDPRFYSRDLLKRIQSLTKK